MIYKYIYPLKAQENAGKALLMNPTLRARLVIALFTAALAMSTTSACTTAHETTVPNAVATITPSMPRRPVQQPGPHKDTQTNRACILTTEQAGKVIGSPVQVQTLGHDDPNSDWDPDFVCAYANEGQRIHIQLGCNAPSDANIPPQTQRPDGTVYGVFGDKEHCFFILKVQVVGDNPEERSAAIAIQLDGQIRENWSSRS